MYILLTICFMYNYPHTHTHTQRKERLITIISLPRKSRRRKMTIPIVTSESWLVMLNSSPLLNIFKIRLFLLKKDVILLFGVLMIIWE